MSGKTESIKDMSGALAAGDVPEVRNLVGGA